MELCQSFWERRRGVSKNFCLFESLPACKDEDDERAYPGSHGDLILVPKRLQLVWNFQMKNVIACILFFGSQDSRTQHHRRCPCWYPPAEFCEQSVTTLYELWRISPRSFQIYIIFQNFNTISAKFSGISRDFIGRCTLLHVSKLFANILQAFAGMLQTLRDFDENDAEIAAPHCNLIVPE